jgi:hypothetical protein
MTATQLADFTARMQVELEELRDQFLANGMEEEKLARWNTLEGDKNFFEMLQIAVGYAQAMAFLDHDLVVKKLSIAWNWFMECTTIEIKITKRKLMAIEADSKQAGTPAHEKVKKHVDALESRKKQCMIYAAQYRIAAALPIQPFVNDPKYDATEDYKSWVEENAPKK